MVYMIFLWYPYQIVYGYIVTTDLLLLRVTHRIQDGFFNNIGEYDSGFKIVFIVSKLSLGAPIYLTNEAFLKPVIAYHCHSVDTSGIVIK